LHRLRRTWARRTLISRRRRSSPDTPDAAQFCGQNGTAGGSPLVWETQRAKVEIFPGNGNETTGPHGVIIN